MISFKISTEYIELYKLLKVSGLYGNGGEAKFAISQGEVKVDGQRELRKACKIRAGQKVEAKKEMIVVEK